MKIAILAGVAALAIAAPVSAETWQAFSRSPGSIFLVDVDSIVAEGEVTSIRVASVPREGNPGDYSYSVETYEFRCSADGWRTAGMVEYGPDAAELDAYPEEGAAWEAVRSNTIPAYLKDMACDGARPATAAPFATVQAFVDAGRP